MTKSIEQQIKKIVAKKIKMPDGKTLQERLADEVNRLYDCIQYYIDWYYNSYKPSIYQRTGRFQTSMYAEDIVDARVIENTIQLSILFNDNLAMHRSIFNEHDSFVPALMNFGWNAPKLEKLIGESVYRFTHFDGVHFIEKGINDFNKTNSLGIRINVSAFFDNKMVYKKIF